MPTATLTITSLPRPDKGGARQVTVKAANLPQDGAVFSQPSLSDALAKAASAQPDQQFALTVSAVEPPAAS